MDALPIIIIIVVVAIMWAAIAKEEREKKDERDQLEHDKSTVVRTWLLEAGVRYETTSSGGVGRAIVGGALFGATGAIVGAATASNKTTEKDSGERRFLVEYRDGHKAEQTCKVGSDRYRLYMEKLVLPS